VKKRNMIWLFYGFFQEGELYAVDLTGTRTGGFLASKQLVVVAGLNSYVV
jgi:hypothetical protein